MTGNQYPKTFEQAYSSALLEKGIQRAKVTTGGFISKTDYEPLVHKIMPAGMTYATTN